MNENGASRRRIAVLGAGRMGRRHVEVVKSLGHELVGVADVLPASLDATVSECKIAHELTSVDPIRMLRDVRPECVIVATTATSHADLTIAAFEAGATHVLCEKPMATSLADCDRMIHAASRAGATLAVNHQMRFMPQFVAAKQLIEQESFGPLASVTVIAGNVGLVMNGSHYFEMLRFVTGESVAAVSAWLTEPGAINPRGPEFVDRAGCVRAHTTSGKRLYMELGADQGNAIHIVYAGRYGQLVVNDLTGRFWLTERRAEDRALPTTRYGLPPVERSEQLPATELLGPTRALLTAVLENGDYPTGEDGRRVVASLVACYVSDESGHGPIAIDDLRVDPGRASRRTFPWA